MTNNDDKNELSFIVGLTTILCVIFVIIMITMDACDGGIRTKADIERERKQEELIQFGKDLATEGTLAHQWYEENYPDD